MSLRALQKVLAPLSRKLRLMVSRAVLTIIDDTLTRQTAQASLLAGETRDDIEHFQTYGLSSVPLVGAEGLYLSIGGDREHGALICVGDKRHRPTGLDAGEVALYTDEGLMLHCKRGGEVHLGTSPTDFVALAPSVYTQLQAIQSDLALIKTHVHVCAAPGSPTSTSATLTAMSYSASDPAATKVKAI